MQSVERFAKETAAKYTDLANKHNSRKHIDHLKESNLQLKNVSFDIMVTKSNKNVIKYFRLENCSTASGEPGSRVKDRRVA